MLKAAVQESCDGEVSGLQTLTLSFDATFLSLFGPVVQGGEVETEA